MGISGYKWKVGGVLDSVIRLRPDGYFWRFVIKKYILNDKIKAKSVRLIGSDGTQFGVVALDDAMGKAEQEGLDLMLVAENADPPVCKIIDFGQFKYHQRKKEKQSKKLGKGQVVKELKLSPKISDNDFMVRVNRGREFLGKGFKVKASIQFRGREIIHPELGERVMKRFIESMMDLGNLDGPINLAGKTLLAFVNPK